jgi:type VI secretion system ImpM family protein
VKVAASRYLPVACFGKLPFWPEFLAVDVTEPTARHLKRWLHGGREYAGLQAEEENPPDLPIKAHVRCLIGLSGAAELLAGVVRPSTDRGGRHFPFAVFTHFPRRIYGRHYALLTLALAPIWDALEDAWQQIHLASTEEDFRERLGAVEVPHPADRDAVRAVHRRMVRDDADRLFGREAGTDAGLLAERMPDVVFRMRKLGASDGLGLVLPVSEDLEEACFDAGWWIELLNRQFRLKRFEPSVFIDGRPALKDRLAVLKFGTLAAEDYPCIMGLDPQADPFLRPLPGGSPVAGSATTKSGVSFEELLARKLPRH